MIPYVVLLTISGALGIIFCERKPSLKKEYIILGIMTLIMCFMAAIRSGSVGVDYDWVYRDYFLTVCQSDFSFLFSPQNMYRSEPVYTLLNMAVSIFTHEPLVLWGTASVVIILLRVIFILRNSSKIWLSVFCYIGLGFFSYSMCTLRQELGISVAMFALPFLQKRKPIPYFLIILLAGLCHTSLFILVPIYFLVTIPPNKWMIGLYSVGTLSVILFSVPILAWFTTTFTRFAQYAPGSYYMKGRNFNTIAIWIIIMVIAALLYKKLIERDQKNLVLFNLYLYGTLLMSLTAKHFVFQRVALIFLPFVVMLIPEMVQSMSPSPELLAQLEGLKKGSINEQKRFALKRELSDSKRMNYSIMALLIFVTVLEYLFLLYANRLLLVPYIPFWM